MAKYKFNTAVGMIYAQVLPTMEALGDQPWDVRLRSVEGALLLHYSVEDSSAMGAAEEALRTFLDCRKGLINKSLSIQ